MIDVIYCSGGGCCFSPNGLSITSVSCTDRTLRLWISPTGQCLLTAAWPATYCAISTDGFHLVTAILQGTAILWDTSAVHDFLYLRLCN